MIYLKEYNSYKPETKRPVVCFDFDGVMHTGIYPGTIHPLPKYEQWTPNLPMIAKLRDEARSNDIYILSARDTDGNGKPNPGIVRFVRDNDLPVKGIICTNDEPKLPYLEELGAIRHYDDNVDMVEQMKGSGIEFILVDPTEHLPIDEGQKAGEIWYHGTDSKFKKFDITKTTSGPSAFGIWFTDDEELAKIFGSNILACELSYENPKIISMDAWDEIRGEHAKDTAYFSGWKAQLMSQGYDALFIEERTVKFASQQVRDGNMVCIFNQDDAKIIDESLTEAVDQAGFGSLVLISGEKQPDGLCRLYAAPVQKVLSYARPKADTTAGQGANMVLLGDTYHLLNIVDGKLVAKKVGFSNKMNMLKALGMTEKNLSGERLKLVLNSKTGKTPLYWDTLKYDYMGKMLSALGDEIMKIPNVRWTN